MSIIQLLRQQQQRRRQHRQACTRIIPTTRAIMRAKIATVIVADDTSRYNANT